MVGLWEGADISMGNGICLSRLNALAHNIFEQKYKCQKKHNTGSQRDVPPGDFQETGAWRAMFLTF